MALSLAEASGLVLLCVFVVATGNIIYPGTKWCGDGNVAVSDYDLGSLAAEDSCCRAHDKCPRNILAGETKFGLKNSGNFTWSDCACDTALFNCLKNIHGYIADSIGGIYFDVLKNKFCVRFPTDGSAPYLDKRPVYKSDTSDIIQGIIGLIG